MAGVVDLDHEVNQMIGRIAYDMRHLAENSPFELRQSTELLGAGRERQSTAHCVWFRLPSWPDRPSSASNALQRTGAHTTSSLEATNDAASAWGAIRMAPRQDRKRLKCRP
jgi:hypothetical protein